MFQEMGGRLAAPPPAHRDFNQDRYRATIYVEIEVDTQRGLEGHQFTLTDRDSQITSGYDIFCEQNDMDGPHACDFPVNLLQTALDGRTFSFLMAKYFFTRFVDTSRLDFRMETSQWHLIRVTKLELNMSSYNFERAARAGSFIEMPDHVARCVRNPNNSAKNMKNDQRCFLWALSCAIWDPGFVKKNAQRIAQYTIPETKTPMGPGGEVWKIPEGICTVEMLNAISGHVFEMISLCGFRLKLDTHVGRMVYLRENIFCVVWPK